MDTQRFFSTFVSIFFVFWLAACTAVPPEAPSMPQITPTHTATPPVTVPSPTAMPTSALICSNDLVFLNDLTIPDESVIAPGSQLDKQWLVQNTGSCNWDYRYSLRLISGEALGANEQSLYPARSEAQVTLQVTFTAPSAAGSYLSEWQAFDPDGIPFGDSFYIIIIVQP
jgi:hypothetical protein